MEVEASNRSVSAGLTFKSLANQRWEYPRVPYIPIFYFSLSLLPYSFLAIGSMDLPAHPPPARQRKVLLAVALASMSARSHSVQNYCFLIFHLLYFFLTSRVFFGFLLTVPPPPDGQGWRAGDVGSDNTGV